MLGHIIARDRAIEDYLSKSRLVYTHEAQQLTPPGLSPNSEKMFTLVATALDSASIAPETLALNDKLLAICRREFDTKQKWFDVGAEEYRKRRDAGETAFPRPILLPTARSIEVPSREEGRSIPLRCFVPAGKILGIFVEIHGGGWVLSNAAAQDPYLSRIADESGMIVVSVEYRLAPEHPSPAAEDDCFDVVHHLLSPASTSVFAQTERVRKNIVVGGESAGAHLAASTVIALRQRHQQHVSGLVLNYGVFDLSLTPSAWSGTEPLVLCRRDMEEYLKAYLPDKHLDMAQLRDPRHSPLYADLGGLCPALFSCGTLDCLLVRPNSSKLGRVNVIRNGWLTSHKDDTMLMATRYLQAGNQAKVKLFPGAAHGKSSDLPLSCETRTAAP